MPDLTRIRRALISVSDKTGLEAAARALADRGVELISTGGTAAAIRAAGLAVREVSDITEFPEILGGRVKTLHPRVHAALLADRDDAGHRSDLAVAAADPIDLVAVNLYPFEALADRPDAEWAEAIETIDVGGPTMIRAAAKNCAHVTVCVDADSLNEALAAMDAHDGAVPQVLRRRLAARAFARTAAYDAAIAGWMGPRADREVGLEPGPYAAFGGLRLEALHYGENPHQAAALYRGGPARAGVAAARQIQGRALGFNNLQDADAAYELIAEFDPADGPALAIIKHANPCGAAQAATLADAYDLAFRTDTLSPFGGVVAANVPIDAATAEKIIAIKTDVVIAPEITPDAAAVFARRQATRVLAAGGVPDAQSRGLLARAVAGGLLVQTRDDARVGADDLKIVSKRAPSAKETADMLFAWRVCKHVKSNAIVFAKDGATAGVGAGQTSRVASAKIAAGNAAESARLQGFAAPLTVGSACASDAFFPFADGLEAVAAAGATAVIQPGGSVRDDEVIAAADAAGLAMAFTGVRHFRH